MTSLKDALEPAGRGAGDVDVGVPEVEEPVLPVLLAVAQIGAECLGHLRACSICQGSYL